MSKKNVCGLCKKELECQCPTPTFSTTVVGRCAKCGKRMFCTCKEFVELLKNGGPVKRRRKSEKTGVPKSL